MLYHKTFFIHPLYNSLHLLNAIIMLMVTNNLTLLKIQVIWYFTFCKVLLLTHVMNLLVASVAVAYLEVPWWLMQRIKVSQAGQHKSLDIDWPGSRSVTYEAFRDHPEAQQLLTALSSCYHLCLTVFIWYLYFLNTHGFLARFWAP